MSRNTLFPPLFWLLLALSLWGARPANAAEGSRAYCQIENTISGWQLLNSQCDIGNGLWGQEPKQTSSSFWLQCHYGKRFPNQKVTTIVKSLFPGNSYLVPDNGKYRCLIGPFQNYNQAQIAKAQLAERKLDKSFIRQTVSPVAITSKADSYTQTTGLTSKAATNKASPQPEVLVENRTVLNAVIYSFTFNRLKYYQPRNINSTQEMPPAFIREHNQYWSKVNFLPAANWCKRYGLRLPTAAELKELQTYGQHLLLRHRWPIKSSYWSETINPYSGEIRTLNLRSGRYDEYRPLAQLYTTCVAEAS